MLGCGSACVPDIVSLQIPDQSPFESLASLEATGDPFVRIYGVALPPFDAIAIHTWVVVNPGAGAPSGRWEVWPEAGGPYDYVRMDFFELEAGLPAHEAFAIAELVGDEAVSVVDFVRAMAPEYPCRDTYVLVPGPNSASFVQWVIDQTALDVELPLSAIGQDTRCAP